VFKLYEQHSNNILPVTHQLNALSQSNLRNTIFNLSKVNVSFFCDQVFQVPQANRWPVGQHHDAVSGTEQQNVADDCSTIVLCENFTKIGSTTTDSTSISLSIFQHQRVSTYRRTKSSK